MNTHILPDGKVVEHAHPFNSTEKIPDFDIEDNEWRIVELENDPKEIKI